MGVRALPLGQVAQPPKHRSVFKAVRLGLRSHDVILFFCPRARNPRQETSHYVMSQKELSPGKKILKIGQVHPVSFPARVPRNLRCRFSPPQKREIAGEFMVPLGRPHPLSDVHHLLIYSPTPYPHPPSSASHRQEAAVGPRASGMTSFPPRALALPREPVYSFAFMSSL